MAGGNLKRPSQCYSRARFKHANTSAAATETQTRSKKNRTKSPKDAMEQSEVMFEPADGDADSFEDDPTLWK